MPPERSLRLSRTGAIIIPHLQLAVTPIDRAVGLLSRSSLGQDQALMFPDCTSIHTWGMRFSIDVVFVDREWRIVAIHDDCGPWQMIWPVAGAWATIEMAEGSASRAGLAMGDRLELVGEPL